MKVRSWLFTALCAVVSAAFFAGCGKSEPQKEVAGPRPDSPDAVVTKWHAAIINGQLEDANKYVVGLDENFNARFVKRLRRFKRGAEEGDARDKKILEIWKILKFRTVTSSEDAATVSSQEIEGEAMVLQLKKYNGEWRIDADAEIK